jgi:hypothetical protein
VPRLTIPAAASRYGRRRSPEPDCWLDVPLSLRSTVERLDGADGRPMLFVADRAAYVRLTPGAARLVGRLDGTATGNQLADQISRPAGAGAGEVRRAVVALLDALRTAAALTLAAAPPPHTGLLTGF